MRRISGILIWIAWAGVAIRILMSTLRSGRGAEHSRLDDPMFVTTIVLFIVCGLVFLASTAMQIRSTRADFARAALAVQTASGTRTGRPQEFKGGARLSNLVHASWPMARLTIDPERLTLRMPFTGAIVIPAGRVVSIRSKRAFLSPPGLRIDTNINGEHVTFIPMGDPASVMRALQSAGYPCPTPPAE